MHRGDISIEACTYILQVKDKEINIAKHLGSRALALSIKADDGQPCLLIHTTLHALPCIDFTTKTMLRDEETHYVDALREEGIDQMGACIADERTLIDHQCDTLPLECREKELHTLSTHYDGGSCLCQSWRSPQ